LQFTIQAISEICLANKDNQEKARYAKDFSPEIYLFLELVQQVYQGFLEGYYYWGNRYPRPAV